MKSTECYRVPEDTLGELPSYPYDEDPLEYESQIGVSDEDKNKKRVQAVEDEDVQAVEEEVEVEEVEEEEEEEDEVKDPCVVCQRDVKDEDAAVECDTCKLWCHSTCRGISEVEYQEMQEEEEEIEWHCPSCIDQPPEPRDPPDRL